MSQMTLDPPQRLEGTKQLEYSAGALLAAVQRGLSDITELRRLRLNLISAVLESDANSLTAAAAVLHQLRGVIYKSGLLYVPRTADEDAVAEGLRAILRAGRFDGAGTHAAMAAMMLGSAYDFPHLTDFRGCPEWMVEPYVAYLYWSPRVFLFPGDAGRYGKFLEDLLRWTWSTFQANAKPDHWMNHLFGAAYQCRLIQAYFDNRNLREIFTLRARIFEGVLRRSGYHLDYAFRRLTTMPKRIRVGMLMQDLIARTETFHNLSYFEHLDRNAFEVTLYVFEWFASSLEEYARERAGCVTVLIKGDLKKQVERIQADDLDVMLVANNLTAVTNSTALVAAHKLARVQVALMDSPVTTGFRSNDVFLSSEWNEPAAGAQEQYSERLIQMQGALNCYAYQYDKDPPQLRLDRSHLKVADDAVLYYSGANYYKIVPELFETWAKILAAVPDSILVLMPYNPNWDSGYVKGPFVQRIESQLLAHGVSTQRLRVIEPVPTRADVHAVMRLCDVYLDPYPFAGACSMVDAVTSGLPIVARYGDTARSRHALSTLGPMGLGDLATTDEETYIQKAVALGLQATLRERIAARVKEAMEGQPHISDTVGFARHFAPALHAEFERYVQDSREKAEAESRAPMALAAAVKEASTTAKFQEFTDAQVITQVILPYFRALRQSQGGRFHLVDVGACYGQLAMPFLQDGWTADLIEPDQGAREILNGQLSLVAAQCHVHPFAVSDQSRPDMPFHRAVQHGLSGLSASPYGPTAEITSVRCVRLDELLSEQGVRRIDFLKVDAEGWDFEVLAGNDFDRLRPTMVFVEYGAARQWPKISGVLEAMKVRGYDALLFNYTDDGNFQKGVWTHRLLSVLPGEKANELPAEAFGNILFFPKDDHFLPLAFADLFTAFAQR